MQREEEAAAGPRSSYRGVPFSQACAGVWTTSPHKPESIRHQNGSRGSRRRRGTRRRDVTDAHGAAACGRRLDREAAPSRKRHSELFALRFRDGAASQSSARSATMRGSLPQSLLFCELCDGARGVTSGIEAVEFQPSVQFLPRQSQTRRRARLVAARFADDLFDQAPLHHAQIRRLA